MAGRRELGRSRGPSVAGRVAVVTGAASGIGLALSTQLAASGAQVVLCDLDEARLTAAAQGLADRGHRVSSEVVDVVSGLPALLAETDQRWGRLDYMFNNAGVGASLTVEEADDDHWARVIDLDLQSVIAGTRAAYALMRPRGRGHIVNTASISGLVPFPGQTLYNTAKYGVVGLSTTFRHEAARHGIKVSVACPGAVATPIWGTPVRGRIISSRAPRGAIAADRAAREILAGVVRNQGIIIVPRQARAWAAAYRLAPQTTASVLARGYRRRWGPTPGCRAGP